MLIFVERHLRFELQSFIITSLHFMKHMTTSNIGMIRILFLKYHNHNSKPCFFVLFLMLFGLGNVAKPMICLQEKYEFQTSLTFCLNRAATHHLSQF